MNGPIGNISKLYTKLPVGIQVSEPIDRDSQASRNDASTTTGFTKSFILGKDVSDLTTGFWGKETWKNGIPGFSLHFPKELSYGYLRFEGNGKIALGR